MYYKEKLLLKARFGIEDAELEKLTVGAGSDTWKVTSPQGSFILKRPSESEMNDPSVEPALCAHLLKAGVPVSEFVKNTDGEYLEYSEGRIYHLQKFIAGRNYDLNRAPQILMDDMAATLGKIHKALIDYKGLHQGIGQAFFRRMTPENALASYRQTIEKAALFGDGETVSELETRIELVSHFPYKTIDIAPLSKGATHGDYFISQIIAENQVVKGVIDWTTACVHPYVWEIIRSFVYGDESCLDGEIRGDRLAAYTENYMRQSPLTRRDLEMMCPLFYYQIAVCDYYNQYYTSNTDNREIYLHQARFSTKLMKCLSENTDKLTGDLLGIC